MFTLIKKLKRIVACLVMTCFILPLTNNIAIVNAQGLDVSAQAFVVMDYMSKEVVASRSATKRLPMASTTKIMTALIVLEQGSVDKPFVVNDKAILVEGSSMGLQAGDTVTLRTLAYGMLLASGNDAANAGAVRVGKTIPKFVEMMNEKAVQLGMKNTHFTNPSGLPDDEHYSTAYDMGLLACYALKNPEFSKICSTKQAKLQYGNPPYTRYLSNHNKLLWNYEGSIGLKTGFTKKAGRCLVSAAKKEEQIVVCVTLNAPSDWNDHEVLLDLGFEKGQPTLMGSTDANEDMFVDVINPDGTEEKVAIKPRGVAYNYLPDEKQKDITKRQYLRNFYYAPLTKGQEVGKLEYSYQGEVIFTSKLVVK